MEPGTSGEHNVVCHNFVPRTEVKTDREKRDIICHAGYTAGFVNFSSQIEYHISKRLKADRSMENACFLVIHIYIVRPSIKLGKAKPTSFFGELFYR
jgi:hypothetical protein